MHCFNESAPLANIFDCMKGHNRKLNRLRGREHNGGGAVKRQDEFFIQTDWGHQGWVGGWMGGVSVNPQGSRLHCHHSTAPTPFTQHSTVHNRSCNWWVTAPSNSYGPSIMGLNQTEQEKLGKEMERDGQWKGRSWGEARLSLPPSSHITLAKTELFRTLTSYLYFLWFHQACCWYVER